MENHKCVIHVRKPAAEFVDSSNGGLNYLNSMYHNIQFAMKTETDGHLIYRPDQGCGHSVPGKATNNSLYWNDKSEHHPLKQQSLLYILPYKFKICDPEFPHRTGHTPEKPLLYQMHKMTVSSTHCNRKSDQPNKTPCEWFSLASVGKCKLQKPAM